MIEDADDTLTPAQEYYNDALAMVESGRSSGDSELTLSKRWEREVVGPIRAESGPRNPIEAARRVHMARSAFKLVLRGTPAYAEAS